MDEWGLFVLGWGCAAQGRRWSTETIGRSSVYPRIGRRFPVSVFGAGPLSRRHASGAAGPRV